MNKLSPLIYFCVCFVWFQTVVYVSPESSYNTAAKELLAALQEVDGQYDRVRLAANAFGEKRNRMQAFLEVWGDDPALEPLYGQLKRQAGEFRRLAGELEDAARGFEKSVHWVKPQGGVR